MSDIATVPFLEDFLAGVKQNLNVILICASHLVSDVKLCFMCLLVKIFSFSVCRSALRIVDSVLEASLRCISSRVIQPRIPIKTSSVG